MEKRLEEEYKKKRNEHAVKILDSKNPNKLIIAGPGTGKTYTFSQIFSKSTGKKLALTFIRRLVNDMQNDFGENVEVRTFHEFCKARLHKIKSSFNLEPFLTEVIEKDAYILGMDLNDFDTKFQTMDSMGTEIPFYLSRGDYYNTYSFNDVVYRYLDAVNAKPEIMPKYEQIVIDEYQDFNKLEVSLIEQLEKSGPILIAGDDDQALYDGRCSSPNFIRELYKLARYEKFTLPFCSRCPMAVVESTKFVLNRATELGYFKNRIEKEYECYLPDKEKDSLKHPKIIVAEFPTITTILKFLKSEINNIDKDDIDRSQLNGKEYPTVLIIGPKHYLEFINEGLKDHFRISFEPSENKPHSMGDAVRILILDSESNLGWRVLIEHLYDNETILKNVVINSQEGTAITDMLDAELKNNVKILIESTKKLANGNVDTATYVTEIGADFTKFVDELIYTFSPKEQKTNNLQDKSKPSILLTSYKGAKGLSGGHVFLLGINEGNLPKNSSKITDVEISQFVVALTRTRKKFYALSNKWFTNPKNKTGSWAKKTNRSIFLDWLPSIHTQNLGYIKSEEIN